MNTCKTCKHWDHTVPDDVGVCDCRKITESGDTKYAYKRDTLTYCYDESGYFSTGPDFGCVHHEEKR